jgi:hypothetical protein
MNQIEYIKTVKRKCECCKALVWWKKESKRRIPAKGHWMNDFAQLILKKDKYRKEIRYIAECEKCGKFYFATLTKKQMIESLKYLNFGYKEKPSNTQQQLSEIKTSD